MDASGNDDGGGSKRDVKVIAETLRREGSTAFNAKQIVSTTDAEHLRTVLRGALKDLPPDRYCPAHNRFRQLSWLTVIPWSADIHVNPPKWDPQLQEFVTEFYQNPEANPTDGGVVRKFSPLPSELCGDEALRRLVLTDHGLLHWWSDCNKPLLVGLHLTNHIAYPGAPAVFPPDHLHRDEQPFTFVHLIERRHVTGGENYITPAYYANRALKTVPPEDILAEFTLTEFLDSFVVKDVQVAHYVAPIQVVPGKDRGWRAVLLIDFTPYEPKLVA